MGVPQSKTDIANLALDYIGELPVASIDPPSASEEALLSRHYDTEREKLLRNHLWNFAKKRATISRSGTPAFDYADKYLLPSDFLRFISIEGDTEIEFETDYDIEGEEVLMDNGGANSINIRYIANIEDISLWDATTRAALARAVALAICYHYTKSNKAVERCNAEYNISLAEAINADSMERPPKRRSESNLIRRRRLIGGSRAGIAEINEVI